MKNRFRRVRGGFIPPTPFYKKYRTAATKKSWRTVPLTPAKRGTFNIPGITRRPVRVTPVTKRPTQTQPKLTPKLVIKKVQTQEDMARRKRRAFRYLPTLYKKRPRFPIMRRRNSGLTKKVRPAQRGSSTTYHSEGPRLRKRRFGVSNMTPVQIYHNVGTQRVETGSGYQAVWAATVGTQNDLAEMMDMKPLYMPSGGTGANAAALKQIYVTDYSHKYMITNTSNTTTFLDLYEVEPRSDLSVYPQTAFNDGIKNLIGQQTAGNADAYGMTPFMSKLFTSSYRMKKIFKIEMPPGGTHIHTSHYRINRKYPFANQQGDAGNQIVKGFTKSLLLVAHGEVINSTAVSPVLTPAPVSLNILFTEKRRFRFGEVEVPSMIYSALPAGSFNIPMASLELYDEGSGKVEEYEAA